MEELAVTKDKGEVDWGARKVSVDAENDGAQATGRCVGYPKHSAPSKHQSKSGDEHFSRSFLANWNVRNKEGAKLWNTSAAPA